MPPLVSALMRTGLALKLNQVKRATYAYMHDRTEQGQGIAASYAVAAGLYAVAGIFLIAAILVGAAALFRWVEINYGLFEAFGATAGILVLLTILFAALAANRLKRPSKPIPSLGNRLSTAIQANPAKQLQHTSGSDARSRPASAAAFKPGTSTAAHNPAAGNGPVKAGLVLAATLAGWAFARRRSLSKPPQRTRPSKASA